MRKTILIAIAALFTVNVWGQTQISTSPIWYTNDNVGIGTTSPDYKLDVDGKVQADGFKAKGGGLSIIRPNTTGGWARGIGFYDIDGTTRYANIGMLGNGAISTRIYLAYGDAPWNSPKGMHILPDGKIGVGTTSPNGQLDVKNSSGDGYVFNTEIGTDQTKFIFNESNTNIFSLFYDGSGSAPNNKFHIRDESYSKNMMTFVQQTGNVGIGTTNPLSKVHIADANLPTLRLSGTNLNQSNSGTIEFAEDDVANNEARFAISYDGSANKLHIKSGSVSPSIERLTILRDNGNVGIGTTAPPYKLSVEGTIGAREVIVTSDEWADFVFEENYNLISIKKLESFIKQNKHLPDVPSESEVKENGVSLGEMDKILLQKIEELTLYVIELKKENDELNNKVDALMQE